MAILDFSGFHVRVANNGEQGVAQFSEWNPHLILMGLRMPVMDGLAATQKIRSLGNGHSVKIVAVIASEDHEKHDALIVAGMDSVIGKPYEFDEIYGVLKAHLGIRFFYENARTGD
jgi:two-component system sensor histidine kinase/response regulator